MSNKYSSLDCKSFAILPFVDNRSNQDKAQSSYNAGDVMTDAFETAMIGEGLSVVQNLKSQHQRLL